MLFGYDGKIECEFYNQIYPNLTLTKITSLISIKLCEKVCINYLCAVNFFGDNEKNYALGNGCQKDVVKNCGYGVAFTDAPGNIEFNYIYTSTCAANNGIKDCIDEKIKSDPNGTFGWDKRSDIHYDPEIFGLTTTTTATTTASTITTTLSSTTTTSSGNTFYKLSVTFLATFFAFMFVS
uniref:Uncharacterized protein n=1 Tax=Panagrolaimus sp. PS1159 TaxID=55785 RepID=A0AC35GBD7_9BILA